jgi:hypothetical protein
VLTPKKQADAAALHLVHAVIAAALLAIYRTLQPARVLGAIASGFAYVAISGYRFKGGGNVRAIPEAI